MMFNFMQRFMYGRYGNDTLNRFLMLVSLLLLAVSSFFRFMFPSFLVLALLGLCYYRMLSRNIKRRQAENRWFLSLWLPCKRRLLDWNARLHDSKTHKYYKCSQCKTWLRVPRGKGKINIKCPKCGNQFVKKT